MGICPGAFESLAAVVYDFTYASVTGGKAFDPDGMQKVESYRRLIVKGGELVPYQNESAGCGRSPSTATTLTPAHHTAADLHSRSVPLLVEQYADSI